MGQAVKTTSGFLALSFLLACPALAQTWQTPSDPEIRAILADRIDTQKQSVGMVVGVIDAKGRRIISYGALNQGDPRPLDGDTEYEIGSITKVFTSLVLADMVQRGEVSLSDPVSKYLPSSVKMPSRERQGDHPAGPRHPCLRPAGHAGQFQAQGHGNPYANYTRRSAV